MLNLSLVTSIFWCFSGQACGYPAKRLLLMCTHAVSVSLFVCLFVLSVSGEVSEARSTSTEAGSLQVTQVQGPDSPFTENSHVSRRDARKVIYIIYIYIEVLRATPSVGGSFIPGASNQLEWGLEIRGITYCVGDKNQTNNWL